MYLLSNTQIYKNAGYIPIKIRLKALKLLTQLSKKPKNNFKNEFKFKFSLIPNSKNGNNVKNGSFLNSNLLNPKFQKLEIKKSILKFQIPKIKT